MVKKTVLITGGSKGIGRSIALKFAQNDFIIITCGRDLLGLEKLKSEIVGRGGACHAFQCDVRSKKEISQFVKKAFELSPTIDVLVNNAGIFIPGQIHMEEDGIFEQTMETNLNSTYYTTREVLTGMHAGSHIFNICSTASIMPYVNGGSYCISKYAQYGLTKVLREELKPKNIRVTAVLPGATYTDSWKNSGLPESRFLKPETIAEMIWNCYLLPEDAVVEDLLIRPMLGDIT